MAPFSVVIDDVLHSFNWSGYKSNSFQDQSQDPEITAAFSFDRPVGKVLSFLDRVLTKSVMIEEDLPGFIFPDIVIRVRVKIDRLIPSYVQEILNSPSGKSYFQSNARTSVGMWKIGSEDIRRFPIPIPPLNFQQKLMEAIKQEKVKIAKLTTESNKFVENAYQAVEKMILGLSILCKDFKGKL